MAVRGFGKIMRALDKVGDGQKIDNEINYMCDVHPSLAEVVGRWYEVQLLNK